MSEATRDVEEAAPPVFSFACFPMERVLVLLGILVGPAIAGIVLWRYREMQDLAAQGGATIAFDPGDARLFAGATALVAVLLMLYGLLYLQMRAATRAVVGRDGVTLERPPLLPFGLLGTRRELRWSEVVRAELVARRSFLGISRQVLEIEGYRARLRLAVTDAWPVDGPARPWAPKPPDGGWARHPLVVATTTAFAEAAVSAKRDSSLKSDPQPADDLN